MSSDYGSPVSKFRRFINFFRRGPKLAGTTLLLDRDGTINVDTGYISNPGEIRLEDGALAGLDRLCREGVDFVVLSNQSGIGRGMFESSDLLLIHNRIDSLLQEEHPNLYIKRYFFCPHHPEDKCKCRKPKVGMYKSFLEIYPKSRVLAMVGDKLSDLRMLERFGIPGILVRTGKGAETEKKILSGDVQRPETLAFIGDNLERVARFITSGGLSQFATALAEGSTPETVIEPVQVVPGATPTSSPGRTSSARGGQSVEIESASASPNEVKKPVIEPPVKSASRTETVERHTEPPGDTSKVNGAASEKTTSAAPLKAAKTPKQTHAPADSTEPKLPATDGNGDLTVGGKKAESTDNHVKSRPSKPKLDGVDEKNKPTKELAEPAEPAKPVTPKSVSKEKEKTKPDDTSRAKAKRKTKAKIKAKAKLNPKKKSVKKPATPSKPRGGQKKRAPKRRSGSSKKGKQ